MKSTRSAPPDRRVVIRLVGPGGAGKTTVGRALAERLGIRFVDLDEQFTLRVGDISVFLTTRGYDAYAEQNVQLYLDVLAAVTDDTVLALSSGFMAYDDDAHPGYARIHGEILASPLTVTLLPSFEEDVCIAETVRRQRQRPFSRSADREEQVIRSRFPVYRALPTRKVETARPVDAIVDDLAAYLRPEIDHIGCLRVGRGGVERLTHLSQ